MKNDILEIIQQHKLGHIPDEQAINELCVLFSVVGQSEQLNTAWKALEWVGFERGNEFDDDDINEMLGI